MRKLLPLLAFLLIVAGAGLFVHGLCGIRGTAGTPIYGDGWSADIQWLQPERLQMTLGAVLFSAGWLLRRP